MIKYITTNKFKKIFTCPKCLSLDKPTLKIIKNGVQCKNCNNKYLIKNHILEFIKNNSLDKETKRELKGNTFRLSKKNIDHYATKDEWSSYYNHFVNQKFDYLIYYLNYIQMKGIVSLGSGPGFEIKEILKRKPIKTILSSDLAFSATSVVPHALKDFNINLILFTSDINYNPVIPDDDFPILIYEALHHTGDIHLSIEKLFQNKYKNILFVEPTTNFIIKILAKFNLAQRIEYSGLKPDFLDINILKKLARKYNYKLKIRTLWEIPEDFFKVICKSESKLQTFLLTIIDKISALGNKFQFGSFSIVSLERINKKL